MVMACDQGSSVQIILEGWPWDDSTKLTLSAFTDNMVSETRPIPNGRFKISVPSRDGTITVSLVDTDMAGCKIKYASKNASLASNEPITFKNADLRHLPRPRCACQNGWCIVPQGSMEVNYRTIIGSEQDVVIAGNQKQRAIGVVAPVSEPKFSPDDLPLISSLWIEGKGDHRLWIVARQTPSSIYVKNVREKFQKEHSVVPMQSYYDIDPIIEKVSGPSDGDNRLFIGRSSKTNKSIILNLGSQREWFNSLSEFGDEISGKTLYGLWVQEGDQELWAVGDAGLVVNRRMGKYSIKDYTIGGNSQKIEKAFKTIWCSGWDSCWVAGDDGKIYSSEPGSSNAPKKLNFIVQCTQEGKEKIEKINAIWGTDAKHIWAVGGNGTIMAYDGTRWITSKQGDADLNDVWGKDKNNIWIVGDSGTVLISDPTAVISGNPCNP